MKDFDEARRKREEADRQFQIGGETFTYRAAVAPESILSWTEFASVGDRETAAVNASRARLAAAQGNLSRAEPDDPNRGQYEEAVADQAAQLAERLEALAAVQKSDSDWLGVIDETVLAIVEPEYAETWKKVRDPNLAHPLSLGDLQELLQWLIEQATGRPTGQPSDSSTSAGATATTSTDESSLAEVVALKDSPSDS